MRGKEKQKKKKKEEIIIICFIKLNALRVKRKKKKTYASDSEVVKFILESEVRFMFVILN